METVTDKIIFKYLPKNLRIEFYCAEKKDRTQWVKDNFGEYTISKEFISKYRHVDTAYFSLRDDEMCEMIFSTSNKFVGMDTYLAKEISGATPIRIGDVIELNGENWICDFSGFVKF